MLKFVGDIGLYLPDRDAIKFTALDGKTVVGCFAGASALAALGGSENDGPKELVDRFHIYRNLLERVVRSKWDNGQKRQGPRNEFVVTIEEADLYEYARLRGGQITGGDLITTLGVKHRRTGQRHGVHPAYL
jgi:hypothetical protein